MKIKQTNGNSRNGIKGSRLNFYRDGEVVASMTIDTWDAKGYLLRRNGGMWMEVLKDCLQEALYGYGEGCRPSTELAKEALWKFR